MIRVAAAKFAMRLQPRMSGLQEFVAVPEAEGHHSPLAIYKNGNPARKNSGS
jgi:hypothetical protein